MSFLRFWILWALVGLSVAVWLFWWAIRKGQFEDSRRAGYLPLGDVEDRPGQPLSRAGRLNLAVLLAIAGFGILAMLVALFLAVLY